MNSQLSLLKIRWVWVKRMPFITQMVLYFSFVVTLYVLHWLCEKFQLPKEVHFHPYYPHTLSLFSAPKVACYHLGGHLLRH